MGRVYAATDLETNQPVAVKLLTLPNGDELTRARAFFTRELKAMMSLQHPSLLKHVAHGEVDQQPYIVTELLDGEDLERIVMARGSLPDWVVIAVMEQALEALSSAHGLDIVHRDIKPSNVFLCRDGRVVLLDFGLARATSEAAGETLARGLDTNVMGTPHFLAPESIQGVGLSKRADLYALGATAFFLCTAKTPIDGKVLLEVLRALKEGRTRKLRQERPDVDPRLEAIIQKLMAFEPADRPSEAQEAQRALAPLLVMALASGEAADEATRISARHATLAGFADSAIAATRAHRASQKEKPFTPIRREEVTSTAPSSAASSKGKPRRFTATVRRQSEVVGRSRLHRGLVTIVGFTVAAILGLIVYSLPRGSSSTVAIQPGSGTTVSSGLPSGPIGDPQNPANLALPPPSDAPTVAFPTEASPTVSSPTVAQPANPAPAVAPAATPLSGAGPSAPATSAAAPAAPTTSSNSVANQAVVGATPKRKGALQITLAQWAEIELDGTPLGRKQFAVTLDVDEGSHELVFKNGKYGERRQQISIKRGQNLKLEIDFTK